MPAFSWPRARFTVSWPVVVPLVASLVLAVALLSAGGARPVGLAGPGVSSAPDPAPGAVSLDLASFATRHPGRRAEVIVQLQPSAPVDLVRARIAAAGGTIFRAVPLINGLAVRMRAADARALADVPGVRAVSLNAKVVSTGMIDPGRLASAYNQSIRAEKAWAAGYTGKGVGIAVIDSGLAGDLPDFRGAEGRSRGVVSAVVNPRTGDAKDSFGHGTHVAGLAAGNGFQRDEADPLYGRYAGVAPEARIVAIKADDGNGATDVLSLIDGLHFAVTHAAKYNIRVVNLSVMTQSANSYRTDPLDAAVEAVWMHGIVVVAAAGNLGAAQDAVSHAPGNDPYVITVGAVDDQGTKGLSDDVVASWSSRGTTRDGFAKPDVLAPGAHMVAPLAPGSYYSRACPACVVDGQYLRIGGTSMAAAVVSGAVADILEAHPDWTPDQVKATIVRRGRSVGGEDAEGGAVGGTELALDKVLFSRRGVPEPPANQGLRPNDLIDPATGTITAQDESWAASSWGASSWGASSWGASSWGASSWGAATLQQYVAPWAQVSYTGVSLDPAKFDAGNPQNCWQLARTMASSWGASSWGASSWGSVDLQKAKDDCDAASKAAAAGQASSWGASSWGASSWGASSWGASSWGASSWGASSWGASSWGASSWGASSWGATSWATSYTR